ncbi:MULTISPECIES: M3 family oligoendopeptidase [Planktothricoides]|uniref:M3 family metallopeptidase n=2 Tax=Planktothricoides raciborskii TaxID=132608 RepID=A0AAU8J8B5_9CYAN|nr:MULTISPECIES: M3 family metallopeptidase [Planktothricoides]KOR36770.1 oligoendopeptidase F [Planktothricoides sp. SR001]MBD2545028.1 oligoendopeptidase F [Planktothricoides raciborskii FACHB-1370]MBD2584834.1 oligoendopeptidase F [Planktothricoides raciborskii FACHB-1261]
MVQTTISDAIAQLDSPQEWDLSDLYQGFDDPQLSQDLEALQQQAAQFRETYRGKVSDLTPAEIANCLQTLEAIGQKSGYLYAFPSLIFSADTRNTEAKQFLDKVMEALTGIENQLLFFDLELKQIDTEKFAQLESSTDLSQYRHYLDRIAEFRPHKLAEEVEQTRNQDSLTGRQAFIQLRAVHLGEQEYEPVTTPEGQTASTDAELSALLFNPSPEVRQQAYNSVRNVLKQHNSLYAYILNIVAQDHRIENQMRGYKSTLHKQLLADEVSEPVFRAIMEGTGSRFDLFQRYYRLKGEALGQKVRICDIYAPWTKGDEKPLPSVDYKTGVKTLLEALDQFDINYARRAEEFFIKNWIDAKVRSGKRGGAFCAYSHGKHSYLLLSYTNDYNSVFTLAHEMGHALHFAWIDGAQSYFNSNPPLVLAEVASTFNELLLLDYLLKDAGDDKFLRKSLLTRQLEDQLNLLFRQSTISRLELAIHDRAESGSFDQKFVNAKWMKLYGNLCGDTIELLPEHQYDWSRIGHIFFKPFYCYQYTASNIVSLACYQKYRQVGKDFIPGYLELLAAGGSLNQVEALRQYVDVDIEDTATIRSALDYIQGLLDQLQATL